jgi:signal transduction histidine kinase
MTFGIAENPYGTPRLRTTMNANTERLLRYAGFTTWALTGLPLVVRLFLNPALLSEPQYGLWLVCFAVFGISFALSGWSVAPFWTRNRQLVSLAVQSAAALAMIKLVCSGQEGALLVIVAAQLGWLLPLGQALAWVVGQAFIMCAIIGLSRPSLVSLSLVSTYLGFQVLGLFSCFLTAREASARGELAKANRELHATRQLLADASRSAERERISRELHDSLGHHLTALSLNLEAASHMTSGEAQTQVGRAQQLTKSLLGDVREVVTTLRSVEPMHLRESLDALVELVAQPRVHVKIPDDLTITDPMVAQTVLRCVQESVTNAIKHAEASNLWIELVQRDGKIEVHATDDGRGANPIRFGHGLAGMRERVELIGGRLAVRSRPGSGFDLSVSIPLPAGAP